MNRQIRLVGLGIMVLFVALFVQLNWLQIVHAPALEANPLNSRAVVKEYTAKRGDIVSADGVTLATSVPTNDEFKYLRQYPDRRPVRARSPGTSPSPTAPTGWSAPTTRCSPAPTARSSCRPVSASCAACSPTTIKSQSITLTVLDKLQKVAQAELAGRVGSVVALDPTTGAILAMYSNPSFDPNLLSGHDQTKVQANYKALTATPGVPAAGGATGSASSPGRRSRSSRRPRSTTTSRPWPPRSIRPCPPCRCPQTTNLLHNFGGRGLRRRTCRSCSPCRATPASARSAWTSGPRPCHAEAAQLRLRPDAAHRPARSRPSRPSRRPPASPRTCRAWPTRPSASRTSRPPRSRWPWWPAPSPTAGPS